MPYTNKGIFLKLGDCMDRLEKSLIGIGFFSLGYLLTHQGKNGLRAAENSAITISSDKVVPDGDYSRFTSQKYEVQFDYPSDWVKNPRYEDKYEGKDGFFEVGDYTGVHASIEEAVEDQVNAPHLPYGSHPTIEKATLDGEPACIIYPSDDQNSFYTDKDAAIIVKYPAPNDVNGNLYNFVDIWTTPEYVPLIMKTFKFVRKTES